MAPRPSAGKPNASSYRSIEEILDAAEQFEAPLEGPAPAQVPHGVAGRVEQAAERSEGRLDVEDVAAAAAAHPGRERSTDGHHVERPLMTRPAQERVARLERRRGVRRRVHGQDLGVEKRVADACLEIDRLHVAVQRRSELEPAARARSRCCRCDSGSIRRRGRPPRSDRRRCCGSTWPPRARDRQRRADRCPRRSSGCALA